ncbi:hypothetical protein Purlil1_13352 [Purpureocillium lilacinum]|uniref:Uncharacterized protein n=1 Tax=Purpureocillium lilacinum TaxID=33203 RepID=A0ABR0BEA9_PURLI|nr:hypothetical protein Purlil1_13352 [Purpureocillium lilacinum]
MATGTPVTGKVIATENEPTKAEGARNYWKQAGNEVEPWIELREGDLRETLKVAEGMPEQIDMLLLDISTVLSPPGDRKQTWPKLAVWARQVQKGRRRCEYATNPADFAEPPKALKARTNRAGGRRVSTLTPSLDLQDRITAGFTAYEDGALPHDLPNPGQHAVCSRQLLGNRDTAKIAMPRKSLPSKPSPAESDPSAPWCLTLPQGTLLAPLVLALLHSSSCWLAALWRALVAAAVACLSCKLVQKDSARRGET